MNYSIDRSGHVPAYIQLYEQLVRDITSGIYPLGSRLPSKRVIAAETGLSVITAEHAITLLNEEGYVECRPRSGTFVIYRGEDFPSAFPYTEDSGTESSGSTALISALNASHFVFNSSYI